MFSEKHRTILFARIKKTSHNDVMNCTEDKGKEDDFLTYYQHVKLLNLIFTFKLFIHYGLKS